MRKAKRIHNTQADLLHKKQKEAEKKRNKKLKNIVQKTMNKSKVDILHYPEGTDFKELARNLVFELKQIMERKKWIQDNTISGEKFLSRKNNI